MSLRDGILQISDVETPGALGRHGPWLLAKGKSQGAENLMGQRGKPFAGTSLSSNSHRGRETAACLGKDRRSAGFGPLSRPAHLIVLMQSSINRSHTEQLHLPGAWRLSGSTYSNLQHSGNGGSLVVALRASARPAVGPRMRRAFISSRCCGVRGSAKAHIYLQQRTLHYCVSRLSGRVVMRSPPGGPDQQDPVLFRRRRGCQELVQPTIGLVLTSPWRSGPTLRTHHSGPMAPPCAGPLILQRTGDIQGISHIACMPIPGPLAALPVPRDLAKCLSGAVWRHEAGRPGPCHRHTTLPDTLCLSYPTQFNPTSYFCAPVRQGRGHCLCPSNRKKTLVFQGCRLVTYRL